MRSLEDRIDREIQDVVRTAVKRRLNEMLGEYTAMMELHRDDPDRGFGKLSYEELLKIVRYSDFADFNRIDVKPPHKPYTREELIKICIKEHGVYVPPAKKRRVSK